MIFFKHLNKTTNNDENYKNDDKDSYDCNSSCEHDNCCCNPIGVTGATGATGPTGATGVNGSTSIIPLASGLPISLTTIVAGLAGIPAFIGFGSSAPGLTVLGSSIDLTNPFVQLCIFNA